MTYKKSEYQPNIAIHPGVTLREMLEFSKISNKEFSIRMGISEKHFSQILNGKAPISPDTAIKLERVLGKSASFWNNLEKNYQSNLARIEATKKLEKEKEWVKDFKCYDDLVENKFLEKAKNIDEKVKQLLNFFRVDSLFYVNLLLVDCVSFRKIKSETFDNKAIAAWLRCGELQAERVPVKEFDRTILKSKIKEFKKLTSLPADFDKTLKSLCAEAGVAIVFTPYFKRTKINGAFRWVRNKPIIQLNIRGSHSDTFWFSFFHELGHALLHGKKGEFVNNVESTTGDFLNINPGSDDQQEKEANIFATNELMPASEYKNFIMSGKFSQQDIVNFSKKIEIDPSIVAGRLAYENHTSWQNISHLRKQLTLSIKSEN